MTLKESGEDIFSIFSNLFVLFFLNILSVLIFNFLPQGTDVLLMISEDLAEQSHSFLNLVLLLLALVAWSMTTEFASRYAVYVTDNTGKSLPKERVAFRKEIQKFIAMIFLVLPFATIFFSFMRIWIQNNNTELGIQFYPFLIPEISVLLTGSILAYFYHLSKNKNVEAHGFDARVKKNFNKGRQKLLAKLSRSPEEIAWCNKLYGIYNDYVFSIRKESNFESVIKTDYLKFTSHFKNLNQIEKNNFPKNAEFVEIGSKVNSCFVLKQDMEEEPKLSGAYCWIYFIPNKFYKRLHLQVKSIFFSCLLIFLVITFLPTAAVQVLGAPVLVVLAFTCWTGIYLMVIYLDYGVFRINAGTKPNSGRLLSLISLRALLPLAILISSFVNKDHPARNRQVASKQDRIRLEKHFLNWLDAYKKDGPKPYRYIKDSLGFYPIMFVSTEGGALRTAAYSALFLSYFTDNLRLDTSKVKLDMSKSIYAYSGVSGGSLGLGLYQNINDRIPSHPKDSFLLKNLTLSFFKNDFLAPVISKMFYGEIIQLLIPWHVENFDRAIALEKSWEAAFENIQEIGKPNPFASDFLENYKSKKHIPAFFINTSEVESGRQCWITNVAMQDSLTFQAPYRDLIYSRRLSAINLSTAINYGSRFPLFSPGAEVSVDCKKFHYIDGGYVENSGAATLLEVLHILKPTLDTITINGLKLKPFILSLRYNDNVDTAHTNLNFANEIAEIISGIYNTRMGRTDQAIDALQKFVNNKSAAGLGGRMVVIGLDRNGKEVPLNWALSQRSLKNIDSTIQHSWREKNFNKLKDLFFCDSNCTRK